jgi:hypothetical protein
MERETGREDKMEENMRSMIKTEPHLLKNWIVLALLILFIVIVRARLLEFPLERDEGEYAYMGQLILHGVNPFSMAYTMKFPGTPLMYALMMALFGQTTKGIHLGFMIVNAVNIIMIFLTKKSGTIFQL